MMWHTHIAFAFLVGLAVIKFTDIVLPGNIYIYFVLVLLGALIPDVDHEDSKINKKAKITRFLAKIFMHRGLFHTLFFAILICGIIYIFISKMAGMALFIGYMSHLIADSLTLDGINYLHPVATIHHRGFIKVGGFYENIFFGIVVLLTVLLLI